MHAEFEAIDRYLSMSRSASIEEQNLDMVVVDQKVPHNSYSNSGSTVMISSLFSMGEFAPLDPIPNVGCIEVSESCDQQVYGSESPKSFVDLDNVHTDVSLYDENFVPKREKDSFSDCCMGGNFSPLNQDAILVKDELEANDVEYAIIEYQKKEIDHVCSILRIDQDPKLWSVEDVRKWIVWHAREFNEPQINVEYFHMTGAELCLLTQDDFKQRTILAGSDLYSQLYVWKNVSACRVHEPSYQQVSECDMGMVTNREVSNPRNSPCPSTVSEDSNSSSNLSYTNISDDEYTPYPRHSYEKSSGESEHKQIKLWEFLKDLLLHPETNNNCIKWIDRDAGIFKIEDSVRVAKLWGRRKNRPAMNYDKLSRSIRQYYRKGIIKKTENSKRLVYQFCQPCL